MTMPDYAEFRSRTLSDQVEGTKHAEVVVDVARNLVMPDRFMRLTGGDPAGLDPMIDAQMDRLIVASKGDVRLALFAVTAALGNALILIHGE